MRFTRKLDSSRHRGRHIEHKLYIVEDHKVMRVALLEMLAAEPELSVLGSAASAEEALTALPKLTPDLVIVDASLPGLSGIDLIAHLSDARPELKTLMVSGHSETLYARAALAAGTRGFVTKDDPDAVLAAVRQVLRGDIFLSERLRAALSEQSVRIKS